MSSSSPTRRRSKPSLPALPLLDVPGASLDLGALCMPPLTPLAALNTSTNITPGSLPLLVQMPDGRRKQVDLPPHATVNDLRASLNAPSDWVLNFNSETLENSKPLSNYNITDAYDHAGGLLKMIDTSELQPDQRLDAIRKACSVVAGISRGERDLERIINEALSVENSTDPNNARNSTSREGNIGPGNARNDPDASMANGNEVRDPNAAPNLSFSSFALPDHSGQGTTDNRSGAGAIPMAPPTPSELIRRLGASRPDLYPPKAAQRMMADLASLVAQAGFSATKREQDQAARSGAGMQVAASLSAAMGQEPQEKTDPANYDRDLKSGTDASADRGSESPLKRGNTWFEDVMKSLVPSDENQNHEHKKEPNEEELDDDEGENGASDQSDDESGSSPVASGKESGDQHGQGDDESEAGVGGRRGEDGRGPSMASGGSARIPKKRGRKRKNPEMSEDERKALRQAQNRESAKQSRLRRKTIAAEYEKRVNSLSSENETLRDTISALGDRLQFLQGLLTVSVTQRPTPGPGSLPASVPGLHMPVPPGGTMPMMTQASQHGAAAAAAAATANYIGRPPPPF